MKTQTKVKGVLVLLFLLLTGGFAFGQEKINWHNPEEASFPVLDGQGWTDGLAHFYDRLPERAEKQVRKAVWDLSRDGAGLKIKFKVQTSDIYIRYVVGKRKSMPHMPATGVSGLDLYAVNKNGNWEWAGQWKGGFHFDDTMVYHYSALPEDYAREFHLYLPLYNNVEWMEIGVPDSVDFQFLQKSPDKPIVVYGTSIAQGACASRPGMAWTALLERKLHTPLINLAFSGNGRLESKMIGFLTELDPKMYVLDCQPNMSRFPSDTIRERLAKTVLKLKKEKPDVPILIVEDADEFPGLLSKDLLDSYRKVNEAARQTFISLKSSGIKDLYYLSTDEIGLDIESTVAGVHPNDYGMQIYADAYEQKIRQILHEPKRESSTTIPVKQARSKAYDWNERHEKVLELNRTNKPKTVFLGNSITHYWGGEPYHRIHNGEDSWNTYLKPLGVGNLGFSSDRIENVLWRVYHGEISGFPIDRILINIGTNNLKGNTNEEILEGLALLVQAVRQRQPAAEITLIGIYPRRDQEKRIRALNEGITILAGNENVNFIDPGKKLLKDTDQIEESYFVDGLHPGQSGYEILGKALHEYLTERN